MAIEAKYERKHTDVLKDQRPKIEKYKDKARDPSNAVFFFVIAAVGTYIEPMITMFADLIFVCMCFYFHWLLDQSVVLPFKMPKSAKLLDPNHKKSDGSTGMAEGILYLGNTAKGEEVWFNNNDARTHILYLGTTGSGKTFGLKSIVCNALCWSSGFVYIDGKADTDLWSTLSALARRFGRDDDLLIMNYMTGNASGKVPSNTLNPFSSGSASYLTNMLTSLMPESGGDNAMWKERAISLISAVMPCLVWKRDNQNIPLSIGVIRTYLTFHAVIKLSRDEQIPEVLRRNVRSYLDELPGYVDNLFDDDGNEKPGNENADTSTPRQQHGFLSMQFTRAMSSLGEDYGFIFDTQAADVDMNDVVLNRRILVTLIPALEKSSDETANLGKIISSALKGMMGATLGNTVEGDTATAIDNKPTTSSTPFIAVFDEVGYYAAQGMAVMAAQARSLGFCLIFAGQDMPALEKRVKEEARSITANCNIKIFGKLEDPTQTKEFFEKSVGQSMVTELAGYEKGEESKNVTIQVRSRASYEELKYFGDGQAICTFGKNIAEIKIYNHDIGHAKAMRVHRFLPIIPPSEDVLKNLHIANTVTKKMRDMNWNPEKENALQVDADIEALAKGFTLGLSEKMSFLRAGALAVASVGDHHGLFDAARSSKRDDDEDDNKTSRKVKSVKKQESEGDVSLGSGLSIEDILGNSSSTKKEESVSTTKKEKTEPITWAELIGADSGEADDDQDDSSDDEDFPVLSLSNDQEEEASSVEVKPVTWADLIGITADVEDSADEKMPILTPAVEEVMEEIEEKPSLVFADEEAPKLILQEVVEQSSQAEPAVAEHPVSWQQLIGGATPDEIASMSLEQPSSPVEEKLIEQETTLNKEDESSSVTPVSWMDIIGVSADDESKTGN